MSRFTPIPLLPAILIVALAACSDSGEQRPNLLLVSIDTLRADHLGCYGYERDTSPNLDELASRSRRYANAFAPSPWTLPSHAALLTGVHPANLGIANESGAVSREHPLVAELLTGMGYQTAAFVDSSREGFVGAARGFGRGFETYRHAPHTEASRRAWHHDVSVSVDILVDWLDERDSSRPFFAFLHTKSVHNTPSGAAGFVTGSDSPYDMPEPYLSRFLPEGRMQFEWSRDLFVGSAYLYYLNQLIRQGIPRSELPSEAAVDELVAMYDAGIYWVDEQLGRLLDELEARGLDENTVVVITSDHGEAFGEHRFFLHKELWDSLLRVPLIVHDPREPTAEVIEEPVTLMDVAATLMDLARVAIPANADGVDLPTGPTGTPPRERSLFAYRRFREDDDYRGFSLREGPWKLVLHGDPTAGKLEEELYHWGTDPGERNPRTGDQGVRESLAERLRERIQGIDSSQGEEITVSPETQRKLEALGYAR